MLLGELPPLEDALHAALRREAAVGEAKAEVERDLYETTELAKKQEVRQQALIWQPPTA